MKKRKDSFFGLHFDFHASPEYGTVVGASLTEDMIREICRTIRPDFLQVDCKGHPGYASYQTETGNAYPEIKGDPLAMWRKVTKEEDVALYVHYSGVIDEHYCEKHPEESVMNADGTRSPSSTAGLSSYADNLLIPQLKEIAGKGVDGAWIDGECWGAYSDFSERTLKSFEDETGIKLEGNLPDSPDKPYYEEYREFNRELFRRYLRHYVNSVHAEYPGFEIASNWAFTDHMPEKVCADVDFISGDLSPWDSFFSARYCARAIASQNMTWDLMGWNFRRERSDLPLKVIKHPVEIMQEAAAVISTGGGYQNYIPQLHDGTPDMKQILPMKEVAEFCHTRQPYCKDGHIVHQVAVLLSTYDRARISKYLYTRNGNEPVIGMTDLICDISHSVEICGEHTFCGKCGEYPVIVVPALGFGLARETVKELIDYAKNGGSLVLTGSAAINLFADAGLPVKTDPVDGATFFTLDGNTHGTVWDIANIFSDNMDIIARTDKSRYGDFESLPAFCVIIPYGKGKIALIGADIGRQYNSYMQSEIRDLARILLDKLYDPIVKSDKRAGLEIVILEKDGKRYIQLVNSNGGHGNYRVASEDEIPPLTDITLYVKTAVKPKRAVLHPEEKELAFTYENGRCKVKIDRVDIHSVLEIVE